MLYNRNSETLLEKESSGQVLANNKAKDIHDEEKINNDSEGCGESIRFAAARNFGWQELMDKLFPRHYSQLESNDLPKNMLPLFGQMIFIGWSMQGINTQPLA